MDKYLVSEIPTNQQVIIDVPEGFLRITGYVDHDTGDGKMVFTRAIDYESSGSEVPHGSGIIPLMQMHIQSPLRALVIAEAFINLANEMKEYRDDDDDDDWFDDECETYDCDDCPKHDICFGGDDPDDYEEEEFGNG